MEAATPEIEETICANVRIVRHSHMHVTVMRRCGASQDPRIAIEDAVGNELYADPAAYGLTADAEWELTDYEVAE